jgi:hypothetical protein
MKCWGNLLKSSSGGTDIPAFLAGPFVQVSSGNHAVYTLNAAGVITAYGRVFANQPVGTPPTVPSESWVSLPTNAGFAHGCGITTEVAVSCWGADDFHQVSGTVRVFRQKSTLEDAIGSHACSLIANTRVTNGIPLGSSLLLPVDAVNSVQIRKVLPLHLALTCR